MKDAIEFYTSNEVSKMSSHYKVISHMCCLINDANNLYLRYQEEVKLLENHVLDVLFKSGGEADKAMVINREIASVYFKQIHAVASVGFDSRNEYSFYNIMASLTEKLSGDAPIIDESEIHRNITSSITQYGELMQNWMHMLKWSHTDGNTLSVFLDECKELSMMRSRELLSFQWSEWTRANMRWLDENTVIVYSI
jgi:hypothetical protein